MEEVGAASAGETMTGGRRRRETCRSSTLFSCDVHPGRGRGRVQRERAARVRVRGRRGPPSWSAARSRTINVPSDTIRVPSGSISVHPLVAIRQVPW